MKRRRAEKQVMATSLFRFGIVIVLSVLIQARCAFSAPVFACQRPTTGQSVLVNHVFTDLPGGGLALPPTGVEAQYRLSRPSEKRYVAELNVRFERGSDYDGTLPGPALDLVYRKRVSDCLAEFATSMKGPNDTSLEIRLTKDPAIPEQVVRIAKARARSSSRNYASDISCAVILHESLHLLGLVDEYREKRRDEAGDEQDVYKCRASGPEDSIMNSHEEAAFYASEEDFYAVEECVCAPGFDCRELAKLSDGKECPTGSAWRKSMRSGKRPPGEEKPRMFSFVLSRAEREVIGARRLGGNLLYPAHFRVITEPGCRDVNAVYYSCAPQAYLVEPACPPRADACSGLHFEWLR